MKKSFYFILISLFLSNFLYANVLKPIFPITQKEARSLSSIENSDWSLVSYLTKDSSDNIYLLYKNSVNAYQLFKYDGANFTPITINTTQGQKPLSYLTTDSSGNLYFSYKYDTVRYRYKMLKYDIANSTFTAIESGWYANVSYLTTDSSGNLYFYYKEGLQYQLFKYDVTTSTLTGIENKDWKIIQITSDIQKDSSGNLYFTYYHSSSSTYQVFKYDITNSTLNSFSTLNSSLANLENVGWTYSGRVMMIDNDILYISLESSDESIERIYKFNLTDSTSSAVPNSGWKISSYQAKDNIGNLYFTYRDSNYKYKLFKYDVTNSTLSAIENPSWLGSAGYLTTDTNGDLYFNYMSFYGSSYQLFKYDVTNSTLTAIENSGWSSYISGMTSSFYLTTDSSNNLYFQYLNSNSSEYTLFKYDINNSTFSAIENSLWTGNIDYLTTDSSDNLYFIYEDSSNYEIFKYKTPPTATNLFLSNTPTSVNKGDTLTLNYTYSDVNNNVETNSTFKWYRADDANATNKVAINSATSTTYTVTSSEEKKYIGFSVIPVNAGDSGIETFISDFILVNDTTAPTLSSSTPTNSATGVVISNNIELVFNENIALGSAGTIKIVDDIDGTTTVEINVTNHNSQLSVATTTLTIDPTDDLSANKTYHIEISSGAITDSETNPNSHTGVSDNSVLSFKTPDSIAPTLISSTPTDEANSFNSSSNIVLTFSENIALGTGNIVIYDTNGAVVTIDVTNHSNQLNISNAVLTINPTSDLNFNTDYYITIDATTITDISTNTNAYTGISDNTTLNFKTSLASVDLSHIIVNKWNMIAIPDEREVNATNITGATIWTFNNSSNAWENPTTLIAGKGYIVYTTNITGYNSILATAVTSTLTDDYTTIKEISDNSWTLVGISKSTSGISWSDIYNPTNILKTNCAYTHIFHFDSANDSWNTTTNIPYLGSIWAKQYCPQP